MKTIQERLQDTTNALVLIIGAARILELGGEVGELTDGLTEGELESAIAAAAETAKYEVYWLSTLGDEILNLPAPTDDEREALKRERKAPAAGTEKAAPAGTR